MRGSLILSRFINSTFYKPKEVGEEPKAESSIQNVGLFHCLLYPVTAPGPADPSRSSGDLCGFSDESPQFVPPARGNQLPSHPDILWG